MNRQNWSENTPEAAPPALSAAAAAAQEVSRAGMGANAPDGASPAPGARDLAKDAAFARLRREAELARRENEMLRAALRTGGGAMAPAAYAGAESAAQGRTDYPVSAGGAQEDSFEDRLRFLYEREAMRMFDDDLRALQGIDETFTARDLMQMENDFYVLRSAGVDAKTAFAVVRERAKAQALPAPPSTGSAGTYAPPVKEFYTSEEVDRLTSKDLDNPQIMEKVLKSMSQWKKKHH